MLYICIFSNKFDLPTIRVSHKSVFTKVIKMASVQRTNGLIKMGKEVLKRFRGEKLNLGRDNFLDEKISEIDLNCYWI